MAAAEAFDPFAHDDDDLAPTTPRRSEANPIMPPHRDGPRGSPRGSSRRSSKSNNSDGRTADIMKEFGAAFPSMSLDPNAATDQFGFPSNVFAATFEQQGADDVKAAAKTTTKGNKSAATSSLEGVTFVMSEEMSVIHKSQTNQCSVRVRGNISVSMIICCSCYSPILTRSQLLRFYWYYQSYAAGGSKAKPNHIL